MKVAVIGAGLSGLSCTSKLLEKGFKVHLFEKDRNVGGLADYISLSGYRFPKTYHHVIRNDKALIETLNRFKIAINWRSVKVGIYANSKIFPFNGPFDLIRFTPLSVSDRFRLGWLVLNTKYDARLTDVTVREWVVANAGKKIYEKFISPLISTYFGSSEGIAAAYLARRWSDESKYVSNNLGYTDFPKLIDSYVDYIVSNNGLLTTESDIRAVNIGKREVSITSKVAEDYDAVVFACPTPETRKILRDVSKEITNKLDSVKYRACLCLALRLEEKISSYYWINILNREIPFIACFEHGNLNPSLKGGLIYVVAYVDTTEKLWNLKDETIFELFKEGLQKVFKSTPKVKNWTLFRARYGTPIYKVGYNNITMNPYPRLYFAGVYMAFPEIRSSGPAIKTGAATAEKIAQDFVHQS